MPDKIPLDLIIGRYLRITEIRTKRAVACMTPKARHFFAIIPILLQYNHPILPGFIPGNTPHGISDFRLSEYQQDYLDRMCNVGNCDIRSYIENPAIISLYCMGSTSSVGQSSASDLDIWVCHSHLMSSSDVRKLEQKCSVLTKVARNQDVEVNFFLVPDNKFRCDNNASVDSENCGSALHLLLLEEFYRSSLWMAGKKLVWYLVPDEHDTTTEIYDAYVNSLFGEGRIKSSEWFDLGPVNHIPVQEFFGSAMWLLYKGVDSPYKAVIKIMLMESYASEYPKVDLIASSIRSRMQQSDEYSLNMDSYYMVYEKICSYLNKNDDAERRKVVDSCFLVKVAKGVDENDGSAYMQWRLGFLNDFVAKCGMDKRTVAHFRNSGNWKIADVSAAYATVTKIMLQCSNRLRVFSNRVQKMGSPIDITDFQILTQKLSSTFEYKLDKIIKVNLNIAPSIREKNISLVYVPPGSLNRSGWYLFPASLAPLDLVRHKCVYFSHNAVNVLIWAIVNGVLTSETWVNISENAPKTMIYSLPLLAGELLEHSEEFCRKEITNSDLIGPMYFKNLLLLLNVSDDDTGEGDKKELNLQKIDVLSFGTERRSLLSSLDLVFTNSWGETYVKHYSGREEIIHGLTEMLNVRRPDGSGNGIPYFNVLCYSRYLTGIIRQQISDLVGELLNLAHGTDENNSSMVFMMGDTSYSVIRNHRVTITPLNNSLDFFNSLTALQVQPGDGGRSPYLEKIYQYACRGVVQFFFEQQEDGCMVYIMDENNQLKSYKNQEKNFEQMVDAINRSFAERNVGADGSVMVNDAHFAAPQFYQLSVRGEQIVVENYLERKL